MQTMLKFAADNNIKPIIEEFTHKTANEAIQKIRDGSIRFRAVLKNNLIWGVTFCCVCVYQQIVANKAT